MLKDLVTPENANVFIGKLGDILEKAIDKPLGYAINWGRIWSLWPVHIETACCSVEFGAASSPRYDVERFGIFGYSFFDANRDKVQASDLNSVELTFENIASYKYPGARPLFFYVKKEHVGVIPGIKEFINQFVSDKALSEDGYLFPAGLVPLSEADRAKVDAARDSL